uniref:Uncharacterized protein n=1 Tax=Anguilla anguilla TaxID=7936 RepID=A0A0E9PCJ0_ANGAN
MTLAAMHTLVRTLLHKHTLTQAHSCIYSNTFKHVKMAFRDRVGQSNYSE